MELSEKVYMTSWNQLGSEAVVVRKALLGLVT